MPPTLSRTVRLKPDLLAALQAVQQRDGLPIAEQVRRALHQWLDTVGMPAPRAPVAPRIKMSEERRTQMCAAYSGLLHELAQAETIGAAHRVQIPPVFRRLGARPIGSLSDTEKDEFISLIGTTLQQRTDDFERIFKAMRRRSSRSRPHEKSKQGPAC